MTSFYQKYILKEYCCLKKKIMYSNDDAVKIGTNIIEYLNDTVYFMR